MGNYFFRIRNRIFIIEVIAYGAISRNIESAYELRAYGLRNYKVYFYFLFLWIYIILLVYKSLLYMVLKAYISVY